MPNVDQSMTPLVLSLSLDKPEVQFVKKTHEIDSTTSCSAGFYHSISTTDSDIGLEGGSVVPAKMKFQVIF